MVIFPKTEKIFISLQTRKQPYIYDVYIEGGCQSIKFFNQPKIMSHFVPTIPVFPDMILNERCLG